MKINILKNIRWAFFYFLVVVILGVLMRSAFVFLLPFEIAKETKRYHLENGNTPTQSSISELDRAEMEEFIENIKLLVNTLGHKVFENKRETNNIENKNLLYLEKGKETDRTCKAIGEQTTEGFLVLKGSKITQKVVPSMQKSMQNLREDLISKEIIKDFIFQEDWVFSSPFTAASIILGRNSNGLIEWKNKDGKILKEL